MRQYAGDFEVEDRREFLAAAKKAGLSVPRGIAQQLEVLKVYEVPCKKEGVYRFRVVTNTEGEMREIAEKLQHLAEVNTYPFDHTTAPQGLRRRG